MISNKLIAKVRKLEIKTRRIVDEFTAGAYHSVFKGKGIEFSEVREYTYEDDMRDIDWNVTARTGRPFIKTFTEDRELTVMILVDVSASTAFGSGNVTKHEQIIETAALLALSAIRNNDRVGLLCFSDQTELFLPPRNGRRHGLRLIRELMACEPTTRSTDISAALVHTLNSLKKRTVVFLLSDLMDPNDFSHDLKMVNRRHDVIAVRTLDQLDTQWTENGAFRIEDLETGQTRFFDATQRSTTEYAQAVTKRSTMIGQWCRQAKVDVINLTAGQSILEPLLRFFDKRKAVNR